LAQQYRQVRDDGDDEMADAIGELVGSLDRDLRDSGFRGPIPPLEPTERKRRSRSTKRRQDVPNLPRKKVERHTIGRVIGGYRSSMMVTLTMPSYGSINQDGAV
ncbi:replication initiator protein, partial [Nocardia nova]|nr:replication initiator protein [Nocardia nova]